MGIRYTPLLYRGHPTPAPLGMGCFIPPHLFQEQTPHWYIPDLHPISHPSLLNVAPQYPTDYIPLLHPQIPHPYLLGKDSLTSYCTSSICIPCDSAPHLSHHSPWFPSHCRSMGHAIAEDSKGSGLVGKPMDSSGGRQRFPLESSEQVGAEGVLSHPEETGKENCWMDIQWN